MRREIHLEVMPTTPGRGSADGALLLARLYRQVTGTAMPSVLRAERGKPCFASGTWHFSLSHTRRLVCCALAPFPVGLDAEGLDRPVRPGLAEKVLAPQELETWRAGGGRDRDLLTYWVLKEAWVKYTGQGLRGYPRDLCFTMTPEGPRLAGHDARFCLLEREGHILALCCPSTK